MNGRRDIPRFAVLILAGVLLAGCNDVVSLYPLYDDLTLTMEPSLTGSWSASETLIWTFVPSEGRKYKLSVTEISTSGESNDNESWDFEAGLIELSGKLFLDLFGDDPGTTGAPAHIFARVELHKDTFKGNRLEVEWLDASWMADKLELERHLTYVPSKGRTILTAPTADLRDFFRRHAWDEHAFSSDSK